MDRRKNACFLKILEFVLLFRNDEALNYNLHAIALRMSVTMLWPIKATEKLNM